MRQTFLFYDIETTGLSPCFDQIIQFAAIRTDLKLKELERYNFFVKLNPDVILSPGAVATHNITCEQLQDGICEYEAICKIHELVNTPGTISIGYNSLGFDDEFLRFSFYRNLLPPYTHQYANGCGRADLYPITVMYYLYKNEVLSWPAIDDKLSLRLENLNIENKLVDGQAHDAIVDVEVTIEIARRFINYREMWNYLLDYFNKEKDLARVNKIPEGVLVDGYIGVAKNFQAFAVNMGVHNHYKNQLLWLRLDDERLFTTTVESIPETTYVIRKKLGETYLILPPQQRFLAKFSQDRMELIEKNSAWLRQNPDIYRKIAEYYKEYKYPEIPNVDVDSALYILGFPDSEEEEWMRQFKTVAISEKANLIDKIANPNLYQQAVRVLGRNYPEVLSEELKAEFAVYLERMENPDRDPVVDYRGNIKPGSRGQAAG